MGLPFPRLRPTAKYKLGPGKALQIANFAKLNDARPIVYILVATCELCPTEAWARAMPAFWDFKGLWSGFPIGMGNPSGMGRAVLAG